MMFYPSQHIMDSGSELEGAGDGNVYSSPSPDSDSDAPGYVIRKFSNGLLIPVFKSAAATTTDYEDVHQRGQRRDHESMIKVLKDYLICPICKDPCIETTTTNCGHKFCRQCIDNCRKRKPICPVCSSFVSSSHRLYADDQFVESQLEYLPPEVRSRFKEAEKRRLEQIMEEQKSVNVIKKVRKQLNNSVVYLRCKNSASLISKIQSTSCTFCRKFIELVREHCNISLLVGIFLGALFLYGFRTLSDNATQFFQYMLLAMRNYDGTMPEIWFKSNQPGPSAEPTIPHVSSTLFDDFLDMLDFMNWFGNY